MNVCKILNSTNHNINFKHRLWKSSSSCDEEEIMNHSNERTVKFGYNLIENDIKATLGDVVGEILCSKDYNDKCVTLQLPVLLMKIVFYNFSNKFNK